MYVNKKDFAHKLRECARATLDTRVERYEEEIRRVDALRLLPGWNICNFFVIKEGLAITYEQVHSLSSVSPPRASLLLLLRTFILSVGMR